MAFAYRRRNVRISVVDPGVGKERDVHYKTTGVLEPINVAQAPVPSTQES